MIDHFYYNKQIRRYLLQFGAVFQGLQVQFGKDANGEAKHADVPIHYGSMDKIVAALYNGDTNNKMLQLPMMSFYMTGLELAPERRKGVGLTHRRTFMKEGGVFPDDVEVAHRYMPIPYNMNVDLHLFTSNTEQLYQILETVLMLFDPVLSIQTNDHEWDWTKLTTVELVGISNEENYPAGTERRMIQWTLSFVVPIWISPPMDVKSEVVRNIKLRIWEGTARTINEFDVNGSPLPFGESNEPIVEIDITT